MAPYDHPAAKPRGAVYAVPGAPTTAGPRDQAVYTDTHALSDDSGDATPTYHIPMDQVRETNFITTVSSNISGSWSMPMARTHRARSRWIKAVRLPMTDADATLDASCTYATAPAPQGLVAGGSDASYAVLNRPEGAPPVQAGPSTDRGGLFKSVLADAHGSEAPTYDVPHSPSDGQKDAAAPGMRDNAAHEASTA